MLKTIIVVALMMIYIGIVFSLPHTIADMVLGGIAGFYVGWDLIPRLTDLILAKYNSRYATEE